MKRRKKLPIWYDTKDTQETIPYTQGPFAPNFRYRRSTRGTVTRYGSNGIIRNYTGNRRYGRKRRAYHKRQGLYANMIPIRYWPEIKLATSNGTADNILNTGLFIICNNLVQGLTKTTRLGAEVYCTRFQMRGVISNTHDGPAFVRMIVLVDQSPAGAIFALADLFAVPANPLVSNFANVNRSRFTILQDTTFTFNDSGGTEMQQFSWDEQLKFKTRYDGNAGTIADIQQNAVFVLAISDQAVDYPDMRYAFELYYVDS